MNSSSKYYQSPYSLRKQNYETINYQQSQSPINQYSTIKRNALQQKQIQDLQQKVDLILLHNQQLIAENEQLKRMLQQSQHYLNTNINIAKEQTARFHLDQHQYLVRKLKSELLIKDKEINLISQDLSLSKQAMHKEMQSLEAIIVGLKESNQRLNQENKEITQNAKDIQANIEIQKKEAKREIQRQFEEEIKNRESQNAETIKKIKKEYQLFIKEAEKKHTAEKDQMINRKNSLISKLQENHDNQINELRKEFTTQFNNQMNKLQQESTEKCKNQREKAQAYIKSTLDGIQNEKSSNQDAFIKEIEALRNSLNSRRNLINQLINDQQNLIQEGSETWFEELIQMRKRTKELVQNYFRQTQIFKIKEAEKHQIDIREMVKVYQNKIDVLSIHINYLNAQNQRLRMNFQGQISNKIKQKKQFELEISKLKNLIRKLKIELHGIQEQFKLNIDGVKQHNNTFSMSMVKSVLQQKDKANFFQQQNRKLRQMYERNEKQLQTMKAQTDEKLKYYEQKLQHLKKSINSQKQDLLQKQQQLQAQYTLRQKTLRDNLRRERQHTQQVLDELNSQKENLERQNFDLKEKTNHYELQFKAKDQQLANLNSRLKEAAEHIQKLRMELQMGGHDERRKNDHDQQWKIHYERTIQQLEGDKQALSEDKAVLNDQLSQIVKKYKSLENSLEKTMSSMKKKSHLEKSIVQLGLDNNLVKNLAEIFNSEYKVVNNDSIVQK